MTVFFEALTLQNDGLYDGIFFDFLHIIAIASEPLRETPPETVSKPPRTGSNARPFGEVNNPDKG